MRDVARRTASITITRAEEEDIPLISQLAHEIWPVAYKQVLTPAQVTNMLSIIYAPDNLAREMNSGHCFFLAWKMEEPVGYASVICEEPGLVWLKKLYVDQSLKGQGIGRNMVEAIVEEFKPAEMRLLVNADNEAAQAFYSYIGFAKIGEMPVKMGDYNFIDNIYSRKF